MDNRGADVQKQPIQIAAQKGFLVSFGLRLWREKPLGFLGAVITLVFLLTGIFAGFLAPYGYNDIDPVKHLMPPSFENLLGTDNLGRDLLSRVIYGARVSVIIGLSATTLSIVVSVFIGVITGFFGGMVDLILQRFVDTWMCFPGLIVLIVAISVLGTGTWQVIVVLGLLYGIGGSRVIRGATVSIKENTYVQAARMIGASNTRVILFHVLPNMMAPIIILFSVRIAAVILVEAVMSFLGLGVPPPIPSWGGMLNAQGRMYLTKAPLLGIAPGVALALVVYGINVFGDALRDILDPRLRGGIGSFAESVKKK
ncbi:ABC transporter permease [bacterium]|nr:ABC transporter permease [bacterium]